MILEMTKILSGAVLRAVEGSGPSVSEAWIPELYERTGFQLRIAGKITVHRPKAHRAAVGTHGSAVGFRGIHRAFTLLELILVMLIIAIAAAVVVPSLTEFAVGRSTENAAQQIVNLAQYARTQSISEGRTFRLNFDTQADKIWLTARKEGTFQPPGNDFGQKYSLAEGMKMSVQIQPQPNTQLILTPNVTATDVQPTPLFGQPVWPLMNTQMQIAHTDPGIYSEFQPSGRIDPVLVKLVDKRGKEVDLGCATATESLHVLSKLELQ